MKGFRGGGKKPQEFTMADIVQCPCGRNERRKAVGQTRCAACVIAGADYNEGAPRERRDSVTVSIPPSIYDLWHTLPDGTKVKTAIYLAWEEAHIDMIRETFWWLKPPIGVFVTIYGGTGFNESRDMDNAMKATIDILVAAGSIHDDCVRYVVEIGGRYLPPCDKTTPAYATIRVVEFRR